MVGELICFCACCCWWILLVYQSFSLESRYPLIRGRELRLQETFDFRVVGIVPFYMAEVGLLPSVPLGVSSCPRLPSPLPCLPFSVGTLLFSLFFNSSQHSTFHIPSDSLNFPQDQHTSLSRDSAPPRVLSPPSIVVSGTAFP